MNSSVKILLAVLGFTMLIVVAAVVLASNEKTIDAKAQGVASMTIDKLQQDLGSMKVSDEKSAIFTVTNTGKTPLRVWNVATSCDCTSATFTINGKETPEFNMPAHMGTTLRNWLGEVAAGQKALLKVTYRPSIMPVTGPVTRNVDFATNDPKNAKVEVTVSANVL